MVVCKGLSCSSPQSRWNGRTSKRQELARRGKLRGPGFGGELWGCEGVLGTDRQVTTSRSDSLGILEVFPISLFH